MQPSQVDRFLVEILDVSSLTCVDSSETAPDLSTELETLDGDAADGAN
jgi:hypothetical protein